MHAQPAPLHFLIVENWEEREGRTVIELQSRKYKQTKKPHLTQIELYVYVGFHVLSA